MVESLDGMLGKESMKNLENNYPFRFYGSSLPAK